MRGKNWACKLNDCRQAMKRGDKSASVPRGSRELRELL